MPRIDRRWLRATLWTAAALLVAFGGLAAWYVPRYVTPQPIDIVASFAVPGATEYVDPVTKQPADPSDPTATDTGNTVWYSITYTPDATVRIVTGIGNDGSHPVRVTAISLPCVPAPADECAMTPVRRAVPIYATAEMGGENLAPFAPFTLTPGQLGYIGWDLTLCPAGGPDTTPAGPGLASGLDTFQITYVYGGWTHVVRLPLGTALVVQAPVRCFSA